MSVIIRNTAGTILAYLSENVPGGAAGAALSGSVILAANGTTDTFEVWFFHTRASGSANRSVRGTAEYSYFWGTLLP